LRQNSLKIAFLFLSLFIFGCKTSPVPPEVKEAEIQEHNLWRAGAPVYALEDYNQYKQALRLAKDKLIKERAKFGWFRNYEAVKAEFRKVLNSGEEILRRVQKRKEIKSESLSNQLSILTERINTLKKIVFSINEGQLVRKSLTQTELALMEADLLFKKEKYDAVSERLKDVSTYINKIEESVFSILERYTNEAQIKKWRKWVDETLTESKKEGRTAIIVNKLDRKLILYKKGIPFVSFDIGLGRYGLSDKLHAGDDATPEGRYEIIKKLSESHYYKALLINYPNEEDKRQFYLAKKKGLVPPRVGIGGLIEIHGGGKDSLTYGCISVENEVMDKIFTLVEVGTPVTIVGAVDSENSIIAMLKNR
jgi:hypothetical protein